MKSRDQDRVHSETESRPEPRAVPEIPHLRTSSPQLLRFAGNQSLQRMLAPDGSRTPGPAARPRLNAAAPAVQRQPVESAGAGTAAEAAAPAAGMAGPAPAAPELIVEDSAQTLAPGQMRRREFLAQLRSAVCATADEALAGTIWSAAGCPWIDHWFAYYGDRSSRQIEGALRRYAPEAAAATSAQAYIPIVQSRVRRAIASWRDTGEVTGVPALADSGAGEPQAGGSGEAIFGKGSDPAALSATDPRAVREGLGSGRSLDSRVRSRLGGAFGTDFSQVRIHTDEGASETAARLGARAFTVGRHVAFGEGEYRPGTLVGDALIAHELAHVLQQEGVDSAAPKAYDGYDALEEDADLAAVTAVGSLWGQLGRDGRRLPRLKSALGLSLQRCNSNKKTTTPTLKDTLRQLLSGAPTVDAVIAAIHTAPTSERQAALADSGLLGLIRSKFSGDDRIVIMSALLEGSFKWQNPTANFFFDFFVTRKQTGTVPNASTMNCWESVMYAALLAGEINEAWIRSFYTTALAAPNATSAAYSQLGFSTSLPTNPPAMPRRGQLVFYAPAGSSAPSHVLLSLGGNLGMSLWNEPHNDNFVQRIRLDELTGTRYIADAPW